MCEPTIRRAALSLFALVAALGFPLAAQSATINMIISDVDVSYSGGAAGNTGSIFDVIAHPGGNLNPAESDEVESVVFELDMVNQGTLTSVPANVLSADLRVDGVGATLPLNTFQTGIGSNGGGFGFDWFSASGEKLRLGIDKVDVLLTNNVLFFTGTASLLDQNLPFGLQFKASEPIVFSYTATLPGVVGSPATGAMASGALTISGEQVPEPGTLILIVASALASVAVFRRR